MKKNMIIAIVPVLIAGLLYLLLSFVTWESNPAKWESAARGIGAFMWVIFSLLGTGAINDLIKTKQP